MNRANPRIADYPIDSIFLQRWSSHAFTGEQISQEDLFTMLEAARWAPSAYNSQPWRFLYARRDTEHWPQFFGLLNAYNQGWAKDAAALVILLSQTMLRRPGTDEAVQSYNHSLDAGAAWANLALQAARSGWVANAIGGFDVARTASELGVPADYRVEVAIAIGRAPEKSALPPRKVPVGRVPLQQLVREGCFAE